MNILGTNIQTVGQLREALKDVPDAILLNIGDAAHGYDVHKIVYDGISVAIMTNDADMVEKRWKLADSVGESTPCIIQHGVLTPTGVPTYLKRQEYAIESTWTTEPTYAKRFATPDDAIEHIEKFMKGQRGILICPAPSAQTTPAETEDIHAD